MKRLRKKDVEFLKNNSEYYESKHYNKKTGEWQDKKKISYKNKGPKNKSEIDRENIIKRDNYRCATCGQNVNLEIHHVVHRSKGGTDEPENLITLCSLCHYKIHINEPVGNLMRKRLKRQGIIL